MLHSWYACSGISVDVVPDADATVDVLGNTIKYLRIQEEVLEKVKEDVNSLSTYTLHQSIRSPRSDHQWCEWVQRARTRTSLRVAVVVDVDVVVLRLLHPLSTSLSCMWLFG